MQGKDRIIVALDVPDKETALLNVAILKDHVGLFKVGSELFVAEGPEVVRNIGPDRVFLDLKFHDIPNTVRAVVRVATRLNVKMLNVHTLGARKMLQATHEGQYLPGREYAEELPIILGVTILTSHDEASLEEVGMSGEIAIPYRVRNLAELAIACNLDGVVCSPQEIKIVREVCGSNFLIITPGIRDSNAPPDDQMRTMTAAEAVAAGADYIVVGRPILQAADPVVAAKKIAAEIDALKMA